MEIHEVTKKEYKEIIPSSYHAFGMSDFNEINKDKCDSLHYLLFKEGKYRLGFIGGIKNNILNSPFSAPFGGFSFISNDIRIQYIDEALKLLIQWAINSKLISINITLPPSIYNDSFIAKQTNSLFRSGFLISKNDLNYYFNLENFNETYKNLIWYNARKNLRIALNSHLNFEKCSSLKEKMLAYEIILQNRNARGFPLRMSWQNVKSTIEIIEADFFLVTFNNITIASAMIFHVHTQIVQVIYWGDLTEYANYKTMNYLSFKVFEYYKSIGIKMVDIGPSTDNSIPNYGLCEFKESIGCNIETKLSFNKTI